MIRLATVEDRRSIQKVLNDVTINLLEKGIKEWNYPWDLDWSDGLYVVEKYGVIIGIFSIVSLNDHLIFPIGNKGDLFLHTIIINPKYQGKKLTLDIIEYVKNIRENLNVDIYLECWNGNTNLKKFYSRAGLNECGVFPEDNLEICVFKF